jgi:hypothetical protein
VTAIPFCRSAPAALAAITTLLTLGASPAWASLTNEVLAQNCVGKLQITEGDTVRVSCDGELTLSGGRLVADKPLLIEGATALHLLDVRITAPEITLRSSGAITLNEGMNLDAPKVAMTAQEGATNASVTVAAGAVIANQASLMVRTQDPTVVAVGFTVVGADRAGGTISVQPGTSLVAQDPAAADGAASTVVAAASAPGVTPAAVSEAPAAATPPGNEGGGGAVGGLGLVALAALVGLALAPARRGQR